MRSGIIILAGGQGTRISSRFGGIAKSMVPINGSPFIDWQLRLLSSHGFRHVLISVAHHSEEIMNFVGDGERYNLNITYSLDGTKPLGTGGALIKALPLLDPFFGVIYGDSYLQIDYRSIIAYAVDNSPKSVMTIKKASGAEVPGNVQCNSNEILKYSKDTAEKEMNYFDFGFTVLHRQTLENLHFTGNFDLSIIFQALISTDLLVGLEVFSDCHEIGSFSGIKSLEKHLGGKK